MIHRIGLDAGTTLIAAMAVTLLLASSPVRGATAGRAETREDRQLLVLENDAARVAVWPQAGGAIVEYLDKATGRDLVVGPVAAGRAAMGWKDMTVPNAAAASSQTFGALPYEGRLLEIEGHPAVEVTCTNDGLRIDRTMWLAADSAELVVQIRTTNVSDHPRPLWARWHPYMTIGDPLAKHSVIVAPEGPQDVSEPTGFRKIFIGQGWEQHFLVKHGFWLAADYVNGQGIWMTFDKTDVPVLGTWTDYKRNANPRRGAFVAEMYPRPVVLAPGETQTHKLAYLPFNQGDDPAAMSLGVLTDEAERAAARSFLQRIKPNLPLIGPYTMQPQPNQGWTANQQNRFYYSHRRRDRAAMDEWGFVDAMMQIPAVQDTPVRLRYVAGMFYDAKKYLNLRYEVTVRDATGKVVREQKHQCGVNPFETNLYDIQDFLTLEGLPDGRYTFAVNVFEGRSKTPMHQYAEQRQLIGEARAKVAAERAARGAQTAIDRETPLVRELRTMALPVLTDPSAPIPIAVEEGGGVARKQWPVTLGVPLPQGRLRDAAAVTLRSPQGQPVPVQTAVQGTWMDGSIKWLQLDFSADVPANQFVLYQLDLKPASAQPLAALVSGEADTLAIDTGAASWRFQQDIWPLVKDGLWWSDADGTTYRFAIKGEDAGITVEQNGPQRSVIKVVGWYTHPDRTRPVAMGELRFEFCRGQPWFRLYHTVTYTGNPWVDKPKSYGLKLTTGRAGFVGSVFGLDDANVKAPAAAMLRQYDHGKATVLSGDNALADGRRATGAVQLAGEKPFSVHLLDAWQLYPKQFVADPAAGTVTLSYWPDFADPVQLVPREDGWLPSSSSMEALAIGMSRTMTITIDPTGAVDPATASKLLDQPMLAITPSRYLAATGAIPSLAPYDPQQLPEIEAALADVMESYRLHREVYGWYGHWVWGSIPNFYIGTESRWADFGRYAHIMNEQDIVHAPWLMYLRTGHREYFQFARTFSRHLMEVGTIRWSDVWPEYVGLSRRHHECIWLSGGDYGHTMLDPFLEDYHATGYRPAWDAAVRTAAAAARVQEGTWRYLSNPLNSLARMYKETQNPFYKQQADRLWNDLCNPDRGEWYVGDHGSRVAAQYGPLNPDALKAWQEIAATKKDQLDNVDSLAGLYRATGDVNWARKAAEAAGKAVAGLRKATEQSKDPMMTAIPSATQHVLAFMRELCFGGDVVLAGRAAAEQDAGKKTP